MKLNTIYTTFNGEVNIGGIGSPAIFLRLQGCPIRCYKRTKGILCDTPEALKKPKENDKVEDIVWRVVEERKKTGVNLITLTGGDPLWNDEKDIIFLLEELSAQGFMISVETSGTLSFLPYRHIKSVYWVLDYKLPSAGIKNPDICFDDKHLDSLTSNDYIKLVIDGITDFIVAKKFIEENYDKTRAKFAVGSYWGGSIMPIELFNLFSYEKMLDKITMNFQVHKLVVSPNFNVTIPKEL